MLKLLRLAILSIPFIAYYTLSYALPPAEHVAITCPPTPAIWTAQPFEGIIVKSNNLRRKTGSPYFASGEFIDIHGYVLDSNCVPVAGAVVEIWQADTLGLLPTLDNLSDIDKHFSYTGTAVTDNIGRFTFATIFPGAGLNRAPRIHFTIKHKDFLHFETYMYFPNNSSNDFDDELKKLIDKKYKALLVSTCAGDDGDLPSAYNFTITLDGFNKYKRY